MALIQIAALLALAHYSGAAEVCCGSIGCFNDNPPFDNFPLPDCADTFGLGYLMFTRQNPNVGQSFDDSSVPSNFNGGRRTVFIAHGWNSNGNSPWMHDMKDAFLAREDMNVVIVDWGGGAEILNYPLAASNTRTVGAYTARVFDNLRGAGGGRFWMIGHSLGGHVSGHTGMRTSLERVTGMDPAGPGFENNPDKTVGLNPSSAPFVDVIHSSVDLGTNRDIGHADFYPAGGSQMPGCFYKESEFSEEIFENWNMDIEPRDACGHSRAYEFVIESIRSDCFIARRHCTDYGNLPGSCSDCSCGFACAYMGYAADSSCDKNGLYYLDVTGSPPYCVG